MDNCISIRCTKAVLLHQPILLYKSFGTVNFNIICDQFQMLEENLSFVHLKDVSFVIYPDKKEEGKKTVHALAKGMLEKALPKLIQPSKELIEFVSNLPQVDYNPNGPDHFFLTNNGQAITEAKELFAYNGIVKVVI